MRKIDRDSRGFLKPGQDLVAAGYAGLEGTIIIAGVKERELLSWFAQSYVEEIQNLKFELLSENLKLWKEFGATECEPAGDGGILAAVWRLSGAYQTGVEFALRRIPVRQETIEVCERFNLNPYRLRAGGCYLMATDNGGRLVERLAKAGVFANVIGRVTEGIKRTVIQDGGIGYLERPREDELMKVV